MALVHTERRGAALLLGLNRPEKHNALDEEMVEQIDRVLAQASREPCVIVLYSTTPGVFAAGADIAQLRDRDADAALRAINAGLFERLEAHRWPTIALVDGPALGGGCELALACDLRLATPRARFAQPELALGILAGAGGNWRLAQVAGLPVARRMLFTGESLEAPAALEAGLADAIHEPGQLLEAGLALAERIGKQSWRALELTKLALRLHRPATTTFDVAAQALLFESDDKRERMTRFLDRQAARKSETPTAATQRPAGDAYEPVGPLQVRQLTIEDGLALAMSPTPGAWHVQDGAQMPDEGYRAVVDADGRLLGYCCFGEAARVTGAPSHPTVLDVSIGIRPGYAGRGWGASLGRAAIAHALTVAKDRRLRTTVPQWKAAAVRVAEQSGFTLVGTVTYDGQPYQVLEQPGTPQPGETPYA